MNDISQQFLDSISTFAFTDAAEVNGFFNQRTTLPFIDWFQGNIAKKQHWKDLAIKDLKIARTNFVKIWDNIAMLFQSQSINLVQFLTLMSVIIHETGGQVEPISEKYGNAQHKGISYLFDRVGTKSSYNTSKYNRTAFDLFNDSDYISAHKGLALGVKLSNTIDKRWSGEVYPSDYSVSSKLNETGFILQADFFKFRGRGLIQTTHRANYRELIVFIKKETHSNQLLVNYQSAWSGLTPEQAATVSTFADWDELFQNTDLILACQAIRTHNLTSGDYLRLPLLAGVLNGKGQGSIYNAGKRVNGGNAYAEQLYHRVVQMINQL